jgi:hypothetical protein
LPELRRQYLLINISSADRQYQLTSSQGGKAAQSVNRVRGPVAGSSKPPVRVADGVDADFPKAITPRLLALNLDIGIVSRFFLARISLPLKHQLIASRKPN